MKKNRILKYIAATIISAIAAITASADGLLISPAPETAVTKEATAAEADKLVFSDISEDASYKAAVYKLVENGVLNGYPDGTFKPDGNLTRAEMCKMINLTFGYTDTEGAAGFPDLIEGEWYVPYVLAAQKAGYIQGYDTGLFMPQNNISREEVCTILYRIIKPYDLDIPVVINDTVSDWARPYVEAMVKNALIPLEEGGIFRATEPIKRHELSTAVAPHSHIKIDDIKCKVTFMNGETAEQILEVSIGKGIETLPTAQTVPAGYKFAGWSRTAEDLVYVDSSFVFVKDTVLYAYFDKLEYKVQFIIDSTTAVSEISVKYKEFAVKPIDPKKNGYTFKGWSTNGSNLVDVATYEITADTVFTAVFEKANDDGVAGGGGFGGGGGGGGGGGVVKPSKPDPKPDEGGDNTGDDNTGDDNTGDDNTGDDNTGDDNTGDDNTGDDNTGDDNTGDDNTGDDNTGDDNTGDDDDDEEVIISYRVTFIVDGEQFGEEQIVKKGECPEVPEEPEVEGYTFLYWSLKEDGQRIDIRFLEIFEDTELYGVFAIDEENPNDPEIIAALKKASGQFGKMKLADDKQKAARKIVIETIDLVLADAEDGAYIDSDYVKENYKPKLLEVKKILNQEMDKSERSDFISRVSSKVDEDVFNLLADFFLSEETKEDYLG